MIIVKNRELLIPNNERYIGTTYDTDTENRVFQVPRFNQRGVDLAALTFRLDIQYANESYDTVILDKEVGEAFIILIWEITSATLQVPGTLYIGIRAIDDEATVKWSSFSAAMYAERHLNTPGNYGGSLTEIEQMEQDHQYMKGVVDELKENIDYAHDAEAWAKGTRSGSAVPSTDTTYHNNSKYYSEQASTKATQAANSATAAANSATQAAETVADTNTRFNNAVAAVTSETEVIDARVGADGTQYTINLKTWQKWSNGDPLTAEDFVYSWKRAADPNTASDYGYLFDVFKKDDKGEIMVQNNGYDQIQFTLNAPCPYMMNLLAFPVYMPVHKASVEAAADWQTNPGAWTSEAGFVSNGAYTLKEWKHNESMVYVKNPNYYDAANVSVDELHFMLSADDTAILAAYKAGNLDYADTVPNGEIPTLKNWPDFHVIDNLGTYYVGFNVKSDMFKGKTPDQANKMRRALALLVNRQYIIDTIGQTQQEPATSFIPTGMSDSHGGKFKENDANYTYPDQASKGYYSVDVNVQGAIDLLKEAGFEFDSNNKLSASTPIHINYLTNEGTGHEGVAQALQQDFAQIGITMDISVEDWQTFLNDRKSGNFDVAREGWLADYDDPINMLEMFTSDSGNNDMQLGK